jgi:serine phosphatase RsbU (regulator of sigma subunit)/Tfp pilus assembly protein PilF
VRYYLEGSRQQMEASPADALTNAEKALKIAERENSGKAMMFDVYEQLALVAHQAGNYDLALSYFLEALHYLSAVEAARVAVVYNHIGDIAFRQGKYDIAMEYFPKALQIREKMNDTDGVASACLNIGSVFHRDGRYELAEEQYGRSLALYEKTGNRRGQVDCYNNLGALAAELERPEEALVYYRLSAEKCLHMELPELLAEIYNNTGATYHHMNRPDSAKHYYRRSLDVLGALPVAKQSLAETYCYIGQFFEETNDKDSALVYYTKAIDAGGAMNLPDILHRALGNRSRLYVEKKRYREAYEDYVRYKAASDLLNDSGRTRHFTEQYMQYLFGKVQQEQLSRSRTQQIANIALSAIVALVGVLAVVLFRSYRRKTRDNILLAEQKREITESIECAEHIQKATLPAVDYMNRILNNRYFILYKPLKTVSGDFYWVMQKGRYIVAAVADCTGHGVQGAFVSMLGISSLNKIVGNSDVPAADAILNRLRTEIVHLLNPEGTENSTQEGMDIALAVIDTETRELEFAGANSPLYLVRRHELFKLGASHMPVGLHDSIDTPFAATKMEYQPDDMIYLFSDGYIDQFGGNKGKRYLSGRLKIFLTGIDDQPVHQQAILIEQEHLAWKGDTPQTDDILMMGIKLS